MMLNPKINMPKSKNLGKTLKTTLKTLKMQHIQISLKIHTETNSRIWNPKIDIPKSKSLVKTLKITLKILHISIFMKIFAD